MQLTRFADLGLRVLMYLTHERRELPVTNAEIASQFEVPHNHVIKVVHKLGKLGWVETTRGRGGGLEPTHSLVDCDTPPCVLRQRCSLKSALDQALAAFYASLNEHTLAELCRNRTGNVLVTLLRKYGT
jgi:Rrf2 family transcriptional regulator, nitric oxide-sensitive transcriptional repressor